MIVLIDDILTLIKNNPEDFEFIPIQDIRLKSNAKIWSSGERIPDEKMGEFKDQGVKQIDLAFSNTLYKMLVIYCPERYKEPSSVKTFIEIDKIVTKYDQLNKLSQRQRYISFLCEIYSTKDNIYEPIFRFNEPINFQKWNSIKPYIKKDIKLPILYNEIGIIVFVDLTCNNHNNGDSTHDYIERFKKNVDLCSILTQRKSDNDNIQISPEFNIMTDIWTVNEPGKLLETYINRNARLIVVGDKINDEYKSALLNLKKYDKYARYIVATDINPDDAKGLLQNIKKAYHTDNYSFD